MVREGFNFFFIIVISAAFFAPISYNKIIEPHESQKSYYSPISAYKICYDYLINTETEENETSKTLFVHFHFIKITFASASLKIFKFIQSANFHCKFLSYLSLFGISPPIFR